MIRENIQFSPLYSGIIKGVSARYCPSLEDKVMRFCERESHPVVLEHEGLDTQEVYAKGLGNCLPLELQYQDCAQRKRIGTGANHAPGLRH